MVLPSPEPNHKLVVMVLSKKHMPPRTQNLPYLHESRHQHAMRRVRGCGGRFLNTKKLDSNATNPSSEKPNFGRSVDSSGSKQLSTGCNGNSDLKDKNGSAFEEAFSNRNSNGLSSMYNFRLTDGEGSDSFNHQRGSMLVRPHMGPNPSSE